MPQLLLLKTIAKRRTGLAGALILCLYLLIALCAGFLAPFEPLIVDPAVRLQPPSGQHLFGTDNFGRDIFSRVMYGTRLSLLTGASIASIAVVLGVFLGTTSGYFARYGLIVMRVMDSLMAFPEIILAMSLVAITGGANLMNVIIALGLVFTPRMARVAYALTLRTRQFDYVEAARAVGANHTAILMRHIIPNLISPIIVQGTFICAFAVLGASTLDFLGVGVPPYVPSWGGMISEGRLYVTRAPWLSVFPGVFILLFVLSLNLLGDALRDALDPRLRNVI